ncbi:hypothetical protein COMA2_20042 [Candidatus Nitrospira nitrificans]|uniref:Uncharacterized protein n=1 Tax=Candidatus Nitrospira nitrificans TaxID=1742973 RepID=A0A0S4LGE5_9BACT|nr:hypothetical protein COMA2_20042 [Candidatus Nitrospira nitrificans]
MQGRSHSGILLSKEFPLAELLRRFRCFIAHHRGRDLSNHILRLTASPRR